MDREALQQEILRIVEEEKRANPRTYNVDCPYQTYERIGFQGLRWSVEQRIEAYGLAELFAPNARVLDIGANFGFFTCEFALHCREADGVEPNPHLNRIGRLVAEHLGIADRVRFLDLPFMELPEDRLYDRILTLAAFYTSDGRERSDAADYFAKIDRLLAPAGILFYESTSFPRDPGPEHVDYGHYAASRAAQEAIRKLFQVEKSWEGPSGRYDRLFIKALKRP